MKYVVITGGVISSLGKGVSISSIASLIQCMGYRVTIKKLDPYLNVDPGTMNPLEHGEVFVTDDGYESDLDLGYYERFTQNHVTKKHCVTAGRIYSNLLQKERNGEFVGKTVQVVPHVTSHIKDFISDNIDDCDVMFCEIGGTVGDIEANPFLESVRQLIQDVGSENCLSIHLSYVPYIRSAGELKTKPTQHSIRELQKSGIQPDIIICRSESDIPTDIKVKLSSSTNVKFDSIFTSVDTDSIYKIPSNYIDQGIDKHIIGKLNLKDKGVDRRSMWKDLELKINSQASQSIKIAIIGKYNSQKDAYLSLNEALYHASLHLGIDAACEFIDAEEIEFMDPDTLTKTLQVFNGILVPGGFGSRGFNGKVIASKYARENNIPYFGICYGMQAAVIDIARNVVNIKDACSFENHNKGTFIINLMKEWDKEGSVEKRNEDTEIGGTMRLGSYQCMISDNTKLMESYNQKSIFERHRHRYEVDVKYKDILEEKSSILFSGMSPCGMLPEAIELKDHAWFIGVQYHPELISNIFNPHPLFLSFIKAANKTKV